MSTAVRVGVDLNSRCSRKCAAPATVAPSSRDPTPTHTPTEAERTPGRYSVTTRKPPGSVVRRNAADGSELCRPRRNGCVDGLTAGRRGIGFRRLRGLRARCSVAVAGFSGIFVDQHQGDLAPLVDVGDLDAKLVAEAHDVFDLRDALAPTEL